MAPNLCFVGIDISKDHRDLHARPTGEAVRSANDSYPIAAASAAAGIRVAVVNPRQVREFARAAGPRRTPWAPPSWPGSPNG